MSLVCKGIDCPEKENCLRYTFRNMDGEGVWYVDEKRQCKYGKDDFLYVKINKDYGKQVDEEQ